MRVPIEATSSYIFDIVYANLAGPATVATCPQSRCQLRVARARNIDNRSTAADTDEPSPRMPQWQMSVRLRVRIDYATLIKPASDSGGGGGPIRTISARALNELKSARRWRRRCPSAALARSSFPVCALFRNKQQLSGLVNTSVYLVNARVCPTVLRSNAAKVASGKLSIWPFDRTFD